MGSLKKFSDGEPVIAADLNELQAYGRKALADELILSMCGSRNNGDIYLGVDNDDIFRPLGHAGAMRHTGAATVVVNGGLWISRAQGATDPDGAAAKIASKLSLTTLTVTGYAGLGAQLRRDIIQARVVQADEAPLSRPFKDVSSGALTTSTNVKRTNFTVEYSLKAGTPAATALLALEPAADSGWFTIGSVLVRSTGITDASETYDWRVPMGDSTLFVMPHEMYAVGSGEWSLGSGGSGSIAQIASVPGGWYLHATCNPQGPAYVETMVADTILYSSAKRVMSVMLRKGYASAPSATQLKFMRWCDGAYVNVGPIWDGNVGLRSSSGFGESVLFGRTTSPTDPPLWSNGCHSQLAITSETRLSLRLQQITAGDAIYGVQYLLAG